MVFSRIVAGVLAAFAVGAAAEVPEYFRAGISGVFPEAKQYREVREKEFSIHDDAGKVLGRLFLESIDDTERRFGYAGTVEVALLFDGENRVAGVLIGKNAETRRYLNRIRRAKFLERWNGLSMEELPGKEVDAVTGATLSCDAISHGVRRLAERCLKRISEERVAAENRSEQVRLTRRIASLKKDLEEGKARDVQPRKGNEVELRLIAAVQGAMRRRRLPRSTVCGFSPIWCPVRPNAPGTVCSPGRTRRWRRIGRSRPNRISSRSGRRFSPIMSFIWGCATGTTPGR